MNITITKSTTSRLSEVDFNNLPFGRIFSDHMFVCDYENGAWQDPQIIPFQDFSMHPASMVLHYGQAIFEGMKASKNLDGQPMFFGLNYMLPESMPQPKEFVCPIFQKIFFWMQSII